MVILNKTTMILASVMSALQNIVQMTIDIIVITSPVTLMYIANKVNDHRLNTTRMIKNKTLTAQKIDSKTAFDKFFEQHTDCNRESNYVDFKLTIRNIHEESIKEIRTNKFEEPILSKDHFLLMESGTIYLQKTIEWFEQSNKSTSDCIEFKKQITFIQQQQQIILNKRIQKLKYINIKRQQEAYNILKCHFEALTPKINKINDNYL